MGLKVLLVGSGGREHALAWKIAQSPLLEALYIAPGNPLMAQLGRLVNIAAGDTLGLKIFAREQGIDLTVVGPEAPLVAGIVDAFRASGLKIFGPTKAAARLEGSKRFAKDLMRKHLIPTAGYSKALSHDQARDILRGMPPPVVIKADGLAEGKGAFVCRTPEDVEEALRILYVEKRFGVAGEICVIEEFMAGEEASLLVLTDGRTLLPLPAAQDHKPLLDGDQGPNTGGMGCYAPAPVLTAELTTRVMKDIVVPTVHAMNSEGCPFQGLLYVGLMITGRNARVVEFNCRFGDPETEPLMLLLKSDLLPVLQAIAGEGLGEEASPLEWHAGAAVGVVLASAGYPGKYEKGHPLRGLNSLPEGVVAFGAGVGGTPENPVTAGGRVLCLTARADSLQKARDKVYLAAQGVSFEGAQYRRDIGHRALDRI